jgi:hypothetical protein
MQRIAAILGCEQLVLVSKREIVEGVMLVIAEEEQRYGALVTTDFTKVDAENRPICTARLQKGVLPGHGIRVAGGSKKNVEKFEPGSQTRFSGRLNGVAPAVFAAALASKLAVSPALAV